MKIITFWIKLREFSSYRKRCLKRIREVYPDAELFAVTDAPENFVDWTIIHPEKCRKILINELNIPAENLINTYYFSDCVRINFLSENLSSLSIDTDVYLLKEIPKIAEGKFGACPDGIHLLFNNSESGYFDNLIQQNKLNLLMGFNGIVSQFDFKKKFVDISDCCIHRSAEHGYRFEEDL